MAAKRVWCQTEPIEIAWLGWDTEKSKRKKAPSKVACPKCKHRFAPRIRECHDQGCWHMYLPAHKKIVKQRKKTRGQ